MRGNFLHHKKAPQFCPCPFEIERKGLHCDAFFYYCLSLEDASGSPSEVSFSPSRKLLFNASAKVSTVCFSAGKMQLQTRRLRRGYRSRCRGRRWKEGQSRVRYRLSKTNLLHPIINTHNLDHLQEVHSIHLELFPLHLSEEQYLMQ